MKRCLGLLSFVAALACLDHGLYKVRTQNSEPISIEWVTPTNGSTVSGTIDLTVNVQSSVAPIVYVTFYRDGVFFKRVFNTNYLAGPSNLTATK